MTKSTIVWKRAEKVRPNYSPGPYFVYLPCVAVGEEEYFESRGFVDFAFWNPYLDAWTRSPYGSDRVSGVLLYASIPRPDPPIVFDTEEGLLEDAAALVPEGNYWKAPWDFVEEDRQGTQVAPVIREGLDYIGRIE